MMAFSTHKVLLALVFAVLLAAGAAAYFFTRDADDRAVTVPERAELSGTYECLPRGEDAGIKDECVPGLLTDEGARYALDFNLLSGTKPELEVGDHLEAAGVLTPLERLSTEYWRQFEVDGIFSVTDSVQRGGGETAVASFRGTLPCADCPGIDTVLALTRHDANSDGGSYTLSLTYLERNVEPFIERGEWMIEHGTPVDPAAVVYALYREGSETVTGRYLKVSDTQIRQLMLDGTPIVSNLPFDLVKEGSTPEAATSTTSMVR